MLLEISDDMLDQVIGGDDGHVYGGGRQLIKTIITRCKNNLHLVIKKGFQK